MRSDVLRPTNSRKYFWTFCILAMIATLVLAGCGGTTPTTTTSTPAATSAPPTPTPSPTPLPATMPLGAVIVHMIELVPGHYVFKPASVTVKAGTVVCGSMIVTGHILSPATRVRQLPSTPLQM